MIFRLSLIGVALMIRMAWPAPAAAMELMEYEVSWVGVSVGTLTIAGGTNAAGHVVRRIHLRSRPWLALIYPVDTTIECTIESTPEGPRHTVVKKVSERDFRQDDTLWLWPDAGRAVWSNALSGKVRRTRVAPGSRDLVSFFFDLRDSLQERSRQLGGASHLIMDGTAHELEIVPGSPRILRTRWGRLEAVPIRVLSKSPTLFSRNRPKLVWVAVAQPMVLAADVESRLGAVRATLKRWEREGQPVMWEGRRAEICKGDEGEEAITDSSPEEATEP